MAAASAAEPVQGLLGERVRRTKNPGPAISGAGAEIFIPSIFGEIPNRNSQAALAVLEFIESCYNPRRQRNSNGNISPMEFERHMVQAA